MSPTLLALLIVSLSLLYINYVNSITHRRNIPGPFMAKLTTLWLVRVTWQRKRHLHDVELHQKYGRIVRVGPKQITQEGPSAVKMVYVCSLNRLSSCNVFSIEYGVLEKPELI